MDQSGSNFDFKFLEFWFFIGTLISGINLYREMVSSSASPSSHVPPRSTSFPTQDGVRYIYSRRARRSKHLPTFKKIKYGVGSGAQFCPFSSRQTSPLTPVSLILLEVTWARKIRSPSSICAWRIGLSSRWVEWFRLTWPAYSSHPGWIWFLLTRLHYSYSSKVSMCSSRVYQFPQCETATVTTESLPTCTRAQVFLKKSNRRCLFRQSHGPNTSKNVRPSFLYICYYW